MPKNKLVDAYIAKSAPFAKPILTHFRKLVHETCPEAEEKMKWSFPHFDYKGPMCSMASFKEHCSIGYWKAALMKDAHLLAEKGEAAMGHYGRITSLKDLPSDKKIVAHIKEAMKLNEEGVKVPKTPVSAKKEITPPDYFIKALNKDKAAKNVFEKFSPSHKREYLEWITEAKTEATQLKRMNQAIEWMAEGKSRNWKYERK